LRHFFNNLKQHLALPWPPGGHTVWADGLSTISCDSLIEKLLDKLLVCHHQTSTKWVANHYGGPCNKVEMFGGQTVGGESNRESIHINIHFFSSVTVWYLRSLVVWCIFPSHI